MHDPRSSFRPDPDRPRLSSARTHDARRRTADEARGSITTGRWMWEWVKAISTVILLFLTVRTFVVEAFKIPTGSMEGTLLVGDFLLVNKAVYGAEIPLTHARLPALAELKRGDVVVFLPPHDPHKNYVKRLVGLPGDTLEMRDKLLYLNGRQVVEAYARHSDPVMDPPDSRMLWQLAHLVDTTLDWRSYRPTRDTWGPLVVPEGKFFSLGDNRDRSDDSRYWGFVDMVAVRGRPIFVYYSFEEDLTRSFPWMTAVRWDRIGELIR
jgi:signal peptidase I